MGCCAERERVGDLRAEQKWDYINLSDFRSTSCFTSLSYGVLYAFLLTSVAVYGVDTFTAVNLLAFDRWSGQIKPIIPFAISKWIFAACIILSWVFLVYRWIRALRAMKSGSVAASYLDPLAVRIQSIRMGKTGRGWRRFLVFAELTKSKKGAEYVALFTYFSFEAWMRIVFAEGPRQVINALTLYSVMQLDLLPAGKHAANDGHTPIAQFFINVQILANSNKQQAVILFSMLFTLVIWVISALSLAIAALMYILFLWHHIPSRDRGLSGYCRRKIDSRLSKIVGVKVKKALEKEDTITRKGGARGPDSTGRPSMKRQPTIPDLQTNPEDRLPQMPMLTRHSTETTMTEYHTRSSTPEDHAMVGLHRQATAPHRPLPPSRTATQSSVNSVTSFASNAPLIGRQSSTGYVGRKATILPTPLPPNYPNIHGGSQRPPLNRSMTGDSQTTRGPYPSVSRPLPSQIQITPPNIGLPSRQGTNWSAYALPHYASPSASKFQMQSLTPGSSVGRSPTDGGYVAFNPLKYAASYKEASNSSPIDSQGRPPHRNLTAPIYQRPNEHVTQPRPPQRSGTAPLPQPSTYDESIYDSYYRPDDDFMRPSMPTRAATAGPSGFQEGWNGQRRAVPGHYQHDCRNTRF